MTLKSKRKDGKGHWPAGRPRNPKPTAKGWKTADAFLRELFRWVAEHYATSALAADMQVPTSTLWRWRHRVYYPKQEDLDRLVKWYLRQQKKEQDRVARPTV